jgi:riboflavin kinase/FMN adenylyltransferase
MKELSAGSNMAIHKLTLQEQAPGECRGGVLTMGNFDGVHKGHLALLGALRDQARAASGPAVAMTFDPHPLQLLRPELFQPVLTTIADRANLLQANGADQVLIMHTTWELLQLTAKEFFEEVIRRRLDAHGLVEGPNFGFGHNREGNIHTLATLSQQAELPAPVIVPSVKLGGIPVSSSRVRSALVQGKVREAAHLLGRCYRIHGTVGMGQRRGQSLGFPTANLQQVPSLIPGDGVYAVRVRWRGATWAGAANIGPNPTFGEQERKVEVHLIDFQEDLYGQELTVDFVERLRDTQPFAGKNQLIAQLQVDVDRARRLIGPTS